jgi:hypothetical protein
MAVELGGGSFYKSNVGPKMQILFCRISDTGVLERGFLLKTVLYFSYSVR